MTSLVSRQMSLPNSVPLTYVVSRTPFPSFSHFSRDLEIKTKVVLVIRCVWRRLHDVINRYPDVDFLLVVYALCMFQL